VRFGYGLPVTANSPEDLLREAEAFRPAGPPANGLKLSQQRVIEEATLRREAKAFPENEREAQIDALHAKVTAWLQEDRHAHVIKAVRYWPPFFSRLLEFWTNHFTVSAAKGAVRHLAGPFVSEAIEPNVMGRFRDLLLAAELHPAMAVFLDLHGSIGPNSRVGKRVGRGLNENLAREILELHTLGVDGGYKQKDVVEFSKIMTGWTVNRESGDLRFAPARAEPGGKTFLDRRFGGPRPRETDFVSALEFVATHPSTARFIATKLARHFIADEPPPEAVERLSSAFIASGGDLPQVYRALWELPQAQERAGAKARNAFEFLVAALRTSSLSEDELKPLWKNGRIRANQLGAGALDQFQQPLWAAPSPAGWPERASEWLAPQALAQRLTWIPRLARHIEDRTAPEFLDRVLGPLASQRTRSVIMAASNRQEGLSLVLASPEFNRR
jgi:uncharacterized protein (DUF1800 family)